MKKYQHVDFFFIIVPPPPFPFIFDRWKRFQQQTLAEKVILYKINETKIIVKKT